MKTLILGLGNPVLTDDGLGFAAVEEVRKRLDGRDVSVSEASVGGLGLVELMVGHDKVIIIDAIQSGAAQPGEILRLQPEEFCANARTAWTHDLSFPTALELGRRLGMQIPTEIVILAVEGLDLCTFGEQLTPPVAATVPQLAELVLQELAR